MRLVRTGTSWSGSERNCVFLNTTDPKSPPRFTNASAVSGLDFADDGRAMAVVDWDRDGDLDIWLRNRTAPRLRLMVNRTNEIQPDSSFVAVRLVGTTSNRDAIGARVELVCKNTPVDQKRVQTVRAGDAFLSQSSKWLHFGLAAGVEPTKVIVHWPGGASETFEGVVGGSRYELKQASGVATRLPMTDAARLEAKELTPLRKTAAARVVLPGRIAFPRINLSFDESKALEPIQFGDKTTLITFWTSACPNCRRELTEFAENHHQFNKSGLNLVAVCLDELDTAQQPIDEATEFLNEIQFPFQTARTDSESLTLLRDFLDTLFGKVPDFVVPLNVLVDRQGEIISFYRGSFPLSVFLQDSNLAGRDDVTRRTLATPFVGTWITKPVTPTQFAEFVGKRLFEKAPQEALRYYELGMISEPNANRQRQLREQITSTHVTLARRAIAASDNLGATQHFESALRLSPHAAIVHQEYGNFLDAQGKSEKAKQHLQKAAELQR